MRRQVTLIEDPLAAAMGEVAGKAMLQEAMEEGEERMVPSAPEMKEKLGGEEEAEPWANLLPRPLLEIPPYPLLKAHSTLIKKIKTKQPWAPLGKEPPLLQVVEHSLLCLYTKDELVDMSV